MLVVEEKQEVVQSVLCGGPGWAKWMESRADTLSIIYRPHIITKLVSYTARTPRGRANGDVQAYVSIQPHPCPTSARMAETDPEKEATAVHAAAASSSGSQLLQWFQQQFQQQLRLGFPPPKHKQRQNYAAAVYRSQKNEEKICHHYLVKWEEKEREEELSHAAKWPRGGMKPLGRLVLLVLAGESPSIN